MEVPNSPKDTEFSPCRFSDIRHIFEKYHYKGGHMGGGITICFSLSYKGQVLGGAVIGKPRQDKKYSKIGQALEIRRMACVDELPRNTESYFLSKCIKYIKKNYPSIATVISYSDRSVGHIGTIYKAANFELIGETAPSQHVFWNGVRYHPRSLTINRPYSFRLRQAVQDGTAYVETGPGKLIFEYKLKPAVEVSKDT